MFDLMTKRTCKTCGKTFYTTASGWGYRIASDAPQITANKRKRHFKYFCSYHCMREYERTHTVAYTVNEAFKHGDFAPYLKRNNTAKILIYLIEEEGIWSSKELEQILNFTPERLNNNLSHTGYKVFRSQIVPRE